MITALISRLVILLLGTLYPAYASYKAVRTKDVKEYVKWMMYWIVFALFTCAETFTDVLIGFWFPFYYEIKIAIVLWMLSPATKGSSFLYRNFVHPSLVKREADIDEYVAKCKEKGYDTVMSLGSRGISYATNVIVQTALKSNIGGGSTILAALSGEQDKGDNRAIVKRKKKNELRDEDELEDETVGSDGEEMVGMVRRSSRKAGGVSASRCN